MHVPSQNPLPLDYETSQGPPTGRRPTWVLVIIIAYASIFLLLCGLPMIADSEGRPWAAGFVVLLLLLEFSLLVIPVKVGRRRPVKRISLWIPIIATGLLMGLIIMMAAFALLEVRDMKKAFAVFDNPTERQSLAAWICVAAGLLVWTIWMILFWTMSAQHDPGTLGSKLHRVLYAGSILELLIAVPSHLAVRKREECCAGLMTGTAICIGVGVAFLAFGPSLALLYYRRIKQIAPPAPRSQQQSETGQ